MYRALRSTLFALPPGAAHSAALCSLGMLESSAWLRRLARPKISNEKAVHTMGLRFPNALGLAAGMDKNGQCPRAFEALGFGHVEIGTVTLEPQVANPSPNLFRLPDDFALINRLGFPNEGAKAVAARLKSHRPGIPLGVSIGKSRSVSSEDLDAVVADYLESFRVVVDVADFVVVNVSSPNTAGLRGLQQSDTATRIFRALRSLSKDARLLVKVAPDLSDEDVLALADTAMLCGFQGLVAANTTITRPGLQTPETRIKDIGAGGLSGPILFERALALVSLIRRRIGPNPCLIGVGGIDSAERAQTMLDAGANLVQLYTALVYHGPGLVGRIVGDLALR